LSESEGHLSAHVAEAVAVAAVAFPLVVDGIFLLAETANAGWDVENRDRHPELRRKARMADLPDCVRSMVEGEKSESARREK
jgi:hypothetical protein